MLHLFTRRVTSLKSNQKSKHNRPIRTAWGQNADELDQNGRQTLLAQLFVHAKEVDLCHFHRSAFRVSPIRHNLVKAGTSNASEKVCVLVVNFAINWDAGDERNKLLGLTHTNSDMPIFVVSGRSQRPAAKTKPQSGE